MALAQHVHDRVRFGLDGQKTAGSNENGVIDQVRAANLQLVDRLRLDLRTGLARNCLKDGAIA